jgi:hypothetical protein
VTGHVVSEARITDTLAALDAYWAEHCRPPTLRALSTAMGKPAYSVTKYALQVAADRGLILAVADGKEQPAYVPLWVRTALRAWMYMHPDDFPNQPERWPR